MFGFPSSAVPVLVVVTGRVSLASSAASDGVGEDDRGVPVLPLIIQPGTDRLRDDSCGGKAQFRLTAGAADPAGAEPASWGVGRPPGALLSLSVTLTGQGIKRVKPKRTTSFFSRQLSSSQGSYTVVQPTDDSLERS